jgi:polyphosphate glucokinase
MKRILVIDIGGTNVKFVATGQTVPRRFPSGPTLTPRKLVAKVKQLTADWKYDLISIGYPGVVQHGRILVEPANLSSGWVDYDFRAAFKRPVKLINDAAMQALGSYRGGLMFFLGLGTGVGSALIADGVLVPMELGHLPYKKATYEDYIGLHGLKRLGKKKWRKHVTNIVERLIKAIRPDEIILGGGNAKLLRKLPNSCRVGANANAFLGGVRLWEDVKWEGMKK